MANRFWVGGTATWDSTTTANWSTTSGGASGASVPGSADVAVFDSNSGAVTVTGNSSLNGMTLQSITFTGTGGFAGTLNLASVSSFTLSSQFSITGSGTRTLTLGSCAITFTGNGVTFWDATTTTNLTLSAASSNLICAPTSAGGQCTFTGGGLTYGTLTVNARTNGTELVIANGNTFSNVLITGPARVGFGLLVTQTITGNFTVTGSSTGLVEIAGSSNNASQAATLALTGATISSTWASYKQITASGQTITSSNSFNLGANTSVTITAPSTSGAIGVIGS